jgi:hypothetical protein
MLNCVDCMIGLWTFLRIQLASRTLLASTQRLDIGEYMALL